MAEKKLTPGDEVQWQSHGTTVDGKVRKKIASETEAAGRKVKASEDAPQYLVESEKTGKNAVHKPAALKRK